MFPLLSTLRLGIEGAEAFQRKAPFGVGWCFDNRTVVTGSGVMVKGADGRCTTEATDA